MVCPFHFTVTGSYFKTWFALETPESLFKLPMQLLAGSANHVQALVFLQNDEFLVKGISFLHRGFFS